MGIKLRGRNPIKIKQNTQDLDPSSRYEPKVAPKKWNDTIKLVAERFRPSARKRRKKK